MQKKYHAQKGSHKQTYRTLRNNFYEARKKKTYHLRRQILTTKKLN